MTTTNKNKLKHRENKGSKKSGNQVKIGAQNLTTILITKEIQEGNKKIMFKIVIMGLQEEEKKLYYLYL